MDEIENPATPNETIEPLRYESNPKHSDPWQPGQKGSICDQEVRHHVVELLQTSQLDGDKRYALFDGRPYCAQEHLPGVWHGYPVGWQHDYTLCGMYGHICLSSPPNGLRRQPNVRRFQNVRRRSGSFHRIQIPTCAPVVAR